MTLILRESELPIVAYQCQNIYFCFHSFKYLSDPLSNVDYTNWAQGEPNDGENGEHCVEVTIRLTSPTSGLATRGEWNDKSCNDLLGFACEKDSACVCKPDE